MERCFYWKWQKGVNTFLFFTIFLFCLAVCHLRGRWTIEGRFEAAGRAELHDAERNGPRSQGLAELAPPL